MSQDIGFWGRLVNYLWSAYSSFVGLFVRRPTVQFSFQAVDYSHNPLKGKPRNPSLSEKKVQDVNQALADFVIYDAENAESVANFDPIKQNTECIFAKKSRVWGSRSYDPNLSLEENVFRSMPTFLKFCLVCEQLGLDMFLFELPGEVYGKSVQEFGQAVRRVLKVISDNDPKGWHCMNKPYVHRKGWVFEFNRITFFVTTFAPCYSSNHSRYAFGCNNCYVSMQPEISFAQHDLPPDTPETKWDCPVTVRDRIRVGFKKSGREYLIRDTIYYPMAEDVVKPLKKDDPLVEWWKAPEGSCEIKKVGTGNVRKPDDVKSKNDKTEKETKLEDDGGHKKKE